MVSKSIECISAFMNSTRIESISAVKIEFRCYAFELKPNRRGSYFIKTQKIIMHISSEINELWNS